MALAEMEQVTRLLVCPRCRSALAPEPGALRCTRPACRYHESPAFPVAGSRPVLVDFERSVLDHDRPPAAGADVERLPAALRRVWKPPNRVAARNVDLLLRSLPGPAPRLLVVGGATVGNGVGAIYSDPRVQVIAFDLVDSPMTQFVADAHQIPLPSGSVDAVLAQAVLEHVLDPAAVVAEVHRVLGKGGLVYAETPFLQQVHAGAYDFVRWTASGHRYLFRRFEEIAAGAVAGPGTQLLWSADHMVRGVTRSRFAGRLTRGLLFWLRWADRLVPANYTADDASSCYFLGRKRDRAMSPGEIVAYYRGAQQPG